MRKEDLLEIGSSEITKFGIVKGRKNLKGVFIGFHTFGANGLEMFGAPLGINFSKSHVEPI